MAFGACGAGKALNWCAPLKSHGRYAYSAITRRADYSWPGKKRLAVYIGFNVEHFDFGAGLGAALGPKSPEPDVLNYSWRDYGNRVGVWRCLELFDSLKLPVGALINTALYDYCPEVVEAHVKRGDELIGHGHTNSDRQGELSEADERRLLEYCIDRIRKESEDRPAGLAQSLDLGERAHAGPAAGDRLQATRSTGATTTSRWNSGRAAARCGRSRIRRS